ncbi:MAG TPA: phosphatase PAP2 family protein [Candidatus Angelobacter sp.]|nr:phosphatase PAP2 family protein [Candidatus Angelobacter sp.]
MAMRKWLKILLTAFLCGASAWLMTDAYFAGTAMPFAFFTLTLASVLVVLVRVGRSWTDMLYTALAGLILAAISIGHFHYRPNWESCVSFLGMGSFVVLGLRAVWSEGELQKRFALAFAPSFVFAAFMVFAGSVLDQTQIWHPKVLDLYLFSFDSSLHVQIAFLLGQAFAMWPVFQALGFAVYVALPVTIAMVYAGQLMRDREKAQPAVIAFLVTGPIGLLFYNLFPALGPVHLFLDRFPWHPLTTQQAARMLCEPLEIKGVQNAIPSLHLTWVLLAWWYSRGLSVWERGVALAFVVFTVFATMGTGEHYFVDLVVAYPFSVMIQALCALPLRWMARERVTSFLYGLLVTLVWLFALGHATKFFWLSPLIPWACCVGTVASAIYLHKKLDAATDAAAVRQSASAGELAVALS